VTPAPAPRIGDARATPRLNGALRARREPQDATVRPERRAVDVPEHVELARGVLPEAEQREADALGFFWRRPPEVVPGYTRAIGIVQPIAVAHHNEPVPDDVVLIPVSPETQAVAFSVYFERPGANLNGPGKNADGTLFVGRMPMAQDKHEPLQPSIPLTGPRPSNTELERMRQIAATGTLATTIIGEQADGAIGLIDLRMEERVLATLERALE
jgi:hypothetical protein